MTRIFSCVFVATLVFPSADRLYAQEVEKKPAPAEFVEVRPYGNKMYGGDRGGTGVYFRKLRRIRAAEGNAAAASRIPAAWRVYNQMRIDSEWSPAKAFDDWGFWTWHEAQYDTGKDDDEWCSMLYRSIYDAAKSEKKMDWVAHVRPNVIITHADLYQWAQVRALSNEAEDYFAGIGFDLDPQKLPEKGAWDPKVPFVKAREFPMILPNSKHLVYWQRFEEKNPDKPIHMDNQLGILILNLATEDIQMGRWDRAMERSQWVRESSNAIIRYNSDKNNKPKIQRNHEDAYRDATSKMVGILLELGYKEKAIELIDDGLARKGASKNDMVIHTWLEALRESLIAVPGKDDGGLIAKMDKAIAREGKFPSIGLGDLDVARYVKASCLIRMKRLDEAEALLRSICERKARRLFGWMDAELELVDLMLHRRELDKAGKTLHELIEVVRIRGVKKDELSLYRKYVKWATLSGNWKEALRGQREVMRLLEAFRMTPLIPQELAVLSRIMAELGNQAESDRLAAQAKSGSVGRDQYFIGLIDEELALRPAAGIAVSKSKVMVQPKKVVSVALENFPARAVVSLMNHGVKEAKGALKVSGLPAKISWDQKTGLGVVEVSDATGKEVEQLSGEIRIEGGAEAFFSCSGILVSEISKTVFFQWVEAGQEAGRCEWKIEAADKVSEGAVIEAAEYHDDPFFLIPVYHHLQTKVKGPVNLRVVTSQPSRVELYDEQGALQMVDSEGNGSLKDSGDWLGVDRDRNLAADLLPDEASGETKFTLHLDPKDWKGEEPLRVRVEWLVDGEWFLAAEDQVVFGK